MKKYEKFNLGNIKLLSGKILNSAHIIYKTYGKLNKDRSNVIILPTFYTGSHIRNEGFIGKNRAINPYKYFIVSINMFGNGLSSSPSKAVKTQFGSKFPTITLWDNVYCQHKLITEKLKIRKVALVTGWSMAGCQSYQWAAQFPNTVKSILPFSVNRFYLHFIKTIDHISNKKKDNGYHDIVTIFQEIDFFDAWGIEKAIHLQTLNSILGMLRQRKKF